MWLFSIGGGDGGCDGGVADREEDEISKKKKVKEKRAISRFLIPLRAKRSNSCGIC
jgi:hypothetical protein